MTISHYTSERTNRGGVPSGNGTSILQSAWLVGSLSRLRAAICVCVAMALGGHSRALYSWHTDLENPGASAAPDASEEMLTGTQAERYALMLCDGYEANRERFQYYICRGEVRWGRLKVSWSHPDVEKLLATDDGLLDARRQGLAVFSRKNCREGTGFLHEFLDIRSRNIWRYRWTNIAEKPGEPVVPRAAAARGRDLCNWNVDLLADDKYYIVAGGTFPADMGEVSKRPSFDRVFFPWRETVWGPVSAMYTLRGYLQIVLPNPTKKAVLTVRKNVRKLGFMTTQVRFTMPGREETWWVCEDKRYIPVLVTVESKESGYRAWRICEDIRRVDRRGWWPMHVAYWSADSWSGIEMRVHEVDVGRRPAPDMFTLTLADTSVHLMEDPPPPVSTKGTMPVTVDDIPTLLARYYGEPEARAVWRYVAIVIVVTSLTVVGASYAYARYRRRG